MATVDTIEAVLVLDTAQFHKALAEASGAAGQLGVAVQDSGVMIERSMSTSAVSVAALGAAMYGTVDAASRFETSMRTLNTIAGLTEAELAAYSDRLSGISLELGTTTNAAANAAAAWEIAGAGFANAADNAKVLEAVLMGATAGQVDAAKYGDLMTGTLNAYGASASEAAKYGDLFFRTIDLGKTTADELSRSLGKVTPVAAAAGIEMEELGAVIATLTANGTRTAEATEGIRGALANLLAPSSQAQKELDRLGITVNQQTLGAKGLIKTLQEIAVANGGSAQSFKTILGDVQAFTAALSLTNDGGVKATAFLDQMGSSAGANAKALEQIGKTFSFSVGQMKVALEAAAISIGEVFLPPLKLMVDAATAAIQAFMAIPEPIRNTGVAVAGLGVAFGAALSSLGALSLLFGGLGVAMNAAKLGSLALAAAQTQLGRAMLTVALARAKDVLAMTRVGSLASAAANKLIVQATAMRAVDAASTAFVTGQTAAATATGTLAMRVGTLIGAMTRLVGVAGLVAVTLGTWHKAQESQIQQTYAQERAVNLAATRTRLLDDAFRSANTSAEELMKTKTGDQLAMEMSAVRQAMLNLKESFDAGNLSAADYERQVSKLRDTLKGLEGKATALEANDKVQIKAGNRSAEGLSEADRKALVDEQLSDITKLSNAKEISAREEIELLEKVLQKAYVNAQERRRIEEQIATLRGQIKTGDEKGAEERRQEALAGELSAIKQLADAKELSARQELVRLEEVLQKHRDITAEERRRIEEQMASLRGRIKDYDAQQAEKAGKEAAKRAEKLRKEALDAELDRIKALRTEGKITANEEINQLRRVLAEYELTESEKRTIHQKTLQIKADADKKAAAEANKDAKKAAAEAEDLSKARDKGDELKAGANDRKVARLQEETERKGVDNRKKINDLLKQSLVLQLQQIQRDADRESVGVESADLLAQIRANAEAKMREEIAKTAQAQKDAAQEQIDALKRIEQERKRGESTFGGIFGIEELGTRLAQERQTTSRRRKPEKADDKIFGGRSLEDIERELTQDINLQVNQVTVDAPALQATLSNLSTTLTKMSPAIRPPESLPAPQWGGSGASRQQQAFSGTLDVRVSVEGPGEIEDVQANAGLDGRYTPLTRAGRGMSGRISFGGA